MADYSDAYEGDCCNRISYSGTHSPTCKNYKGDSTPAVDKKPEKWNTEWDQAYELGLKHGAERERKKWKESFERLNRLAEELYD